MNAKLLPLGIKNPLKTELPALIALEAIGQPWFCDAHRSDLQAIGLISATLAKGGSEFQLLACGLLTELALETLDADRLRPTVIALTAWFQRQPNGRIQAAIDKVLGEVMRKAA